jgi:flagellin
MTVINTNVSATLASNAIVRNDRAMSTAMERLSTGLRINSAGDDAAGLAIASRMRSQVEGLEQAARNANDAVSMIQTAEGAYVEVSNMLSRMKELAVQASSGTYSDTDRAALNLEFGQLQAEMQRIAGNTQWNGFNILDGNSSSVSYQVGAGSGQTMSVAFNTLYKTTWSATAAPAASRNEGPDPGDGSGAINRSVQYAVDFSGVTAGAARANVLADSTAHDPNLHHYLKFTVVDGASNEVDVLIRVTDEILTAVDAGGGRVTVDTNDPEVAYIDGGRSSLATVLSGAGSAGIVIRFGSDNTAGGANAADSIQIEATTGNEGFGIKGNALALVTGEVSSLDSYDVSSAANAQKSVAELDALITKVAAGRAKYGAYINRLEYASDNLSNVAQNTDASRSRIEDADYAAETSELARTQIIAQASTAMLAQANQSKQSVLALLQ